MPCGSSHKIDNIKYLITNNCTISNHIIITRCWANIISMEGCVFTIHTFNYEHMMGVLSPSVDNQYTLTVDLYCCTCHKLVHCGPSHVTVLDNVSLSSHYTRHVRKLDNDGCLAWGQTVPSMTSTFLSCGLAPSMWVAPSPAEHL